MHVLNLDCRLGLAMLLANSVDAIVTDPPYELGFMGKAWDKTGIAFDVAMWAECLRVLKPGGHLLAFSGSRTYHRIACAIEDAGFDIRDQCLWIYGSGFPKSHNLQGDWEGWGTALKPAHEPIVFARKPLTAGTVAANVLQWGTGALNIDGCRVPIDPDADASQLRTMNVSQHDGADGWGMNTTGAREGARVLGTEGRWPANLMHDGSPEVVAIFPSDAGAAAPVRGTEGSAASNGTATNKRNRVEGAYHADNGSAARFFYCPKASKRDRNEGLEHFDPVQTNFARDSRLHKNGDGTPRNKGATAKNAHPTVKPTELMRYLCRLVTPPGGLIVDPFAGSGTTGKAATLEGFQFIGYDTDPEHCRLANARIDHARLLTVAVPVGA